ncbi:hypothetical protein AB4Y45_32105 [Paraburkholderia sp. EG287A]|uniref:hypothetical protein n=1 Tax=Paraburkholderia sp. EG287A TaxID=3237012 RepID=UPI0034D37F31
MASMLVSSSNYEFSGNHTKGTDAQPAGHAGLRARPYLGALMIAAGVALVLAGSQAHAETPTAVKVASQKAATPKPASHSAAGPTAASHAAAAAPKAASQVSAKKPEPAAKVAMDDLFANDTWHAVSPSWPGTLKFDGKTHKVVLSPYGADVIQATYSYTVNPPGPGATTVREGTLHMTNTAGQVSDSKFRIENGKELKLTFQGDVRPESYVRMTPAEESAEMGRIRTLMAQGKLKLPVPTQNKDVQLP